MRTIALLFTFKDLSDEEFEQLTLEIGNWAVGGNPKLLLHGHMPRKVVEENGYDTKLVDVLDEHFPIQLSMYDPTSKKTLRLEMAELAKKLDAEVYVIGEVKGGVAEEVKFFKQYGIEITYIDL